MVSAVSTPQPCANGRAASNAARVRQRWPFSGWAGCQPTARRMPAPESPATRPCPPSLTVAAKTAIVMSALSASTGSVSGPACAADPARSASRNSRCRGRSRRSRWSTRPTAFAPLVIAAALPRLRACLSTTAPAPRAKAPVPSLEPSSTTTTRPMPGSPAAAVTVWRMRSASFRAGMTTATSSTWEPADMGPILGEPVTGRGRLLRNGRLRPAPIGVIDEGEHRVEAGHLEDLAHRGLGGSDLKLTAPLTHPAQAGEQHVHARRVAELHAGHIDHNPGRHAVGQDRAELAVQPRSGIEIDLTGNGHGCVIIVKST